MARFNTGSLRPINEKTHVQDGPRPERSDHSNLDPQERTPHPTVRNKRVRLQRSRAVARDRAHARAR
jgi:hypothetical protein